MIDITSVKVGDKLEYHTHEGIRVVRVEGVDRKHDTVTVRNIERPRTQATATPAQLYPTGTLAEAFPRSSSPLMQTNTPSNMPPTYTTGIPPGTLDLMHQSDGALFPDELEDPDEEQDEGDMDPDELPF